MPGAFFIASRSEENIILPCKTTGSLAAEASDRYLRLGLWAANKIFAS